jgi:hypothetical protein
MGLTAAKAGVPIAALVAGPSLGLRLGSMASGAIGAVSLASRTATSSASVGRACIGVGGRGLLGDSLNCIFDATAPRGLHVVRGLLLRLSSDMDHH